MSTANNIPAIFEPANVNTIVRLAPGAYTDNTLSHTRCLQAGQTLLDRIAAEGMSDALDQEVALFIEKAKATVRKMNTKRSPVTKLFDQLRTVYTSLENDVDPTKNGSLPYQLQQARNAFAAKKHAETEAARRAELLRQQQQMARNRYRSELEEDYKAQFNALVAQACNSLQALDRSITLENAALIETRIREFNVNRKREEWAQILYSRVGAPVELDLDEANRIETAIVTNLEGRFTEQFAFEVGSVRDDILDRLPSKVAELQRMAKASAEEAERIKAQMEERERAEALRKEQERIERERQEKAAAELTSQKQEMSSLFDLPVAAVPTYQPKTQVKKRIVVETADDIMAVVACWWAQEGSNLPIGELTKIFKKQITYCEKIANDKSNPTTIAGIRYDEVVKAK